MEEMLLDETTFDVVVVGTGIAESMLSAALAAQGKSILHLDYNGFYGSNYTTLSLPALEELGETAGEAGESETTGDDSACLPGYAGVPNITNFVVETYQPPVAAAQAADTATKGNEEEKDTTGGEEAEKADECAVADTEATTEDTSGTESPADIPAPPSAAEATTPPLDREAADKAVHERLLKQGRSFNIDLYGTGILSNGRLVELLVNSHVHHYLEFKCFDNSYILSPSGIQEVPCSKKAVFKSKYVSLLEKRQLTRFVKRYVQVAPEEVPDDLDDEQLAAPFAEFLKDKNLSDKLMEIILYTIVLADTDQSSGREGRVATGEGLARMRAYMASLGRYGESPLIYSLFGMSELPQAFSRSSAVKGTIFVLRRGVQRFLVDKESNAVKGVVCSAGQEITAETVICTKNYLLGKRDLLLSHSRAVVVTDRPLVSEKERALISIPPAATSPPVLAYQLDPSVSTSPKGTYLVQLVTKACGPSAREDLSASVAALFSTREQESAEKPPALYTAYFNLQRYSDTAVNSAELPSGLHVCGDFPKEGMELDWAVAVEEAEEIFKRIAGEEVEFFGVTPDPLREEPEQDQADQLIQYAQAIEEHKAEVRRNSTPSTVQKPNSDTAEEATGDEETGTTEKSSPAAAEDAAPGQEAEAAQEVKEEAATTGEAPEPLADQPTE